MQAAVSGLGGKGGKGTGQHATWGDLEAENMRLRAELAKSESHNVSEPHKLSDSHRKNETVTVSYGGSDVTLSQLYATLRGMRDLPTDNEQKGEVQRLIRSLQKTRGNALDPTERLKQLDKIMANIAKDMHRVQTRMQ